MINWRSTSHVSLNSGNLWMVRQGPVDRRCDHLGCRQPRFKDLPGDRIFLRLSRQIEVKLKLGRSVLLEGRALERPTRIVRACAGSAPENIKAYQNSVVGHIQLRSPRMVCVPATSRRRCRRPLLRDGHKVASNQETWPPASSAEKWDRRSRGRGSDRSPLPSYEQSRALAYARRSRPINQRTAS
jgi:hypothetical protein